jgi:uncharacterized membrane protein (UPF0127 family)
VKRPLNKIFGLFLRAKTGTGRPSDDPPAAKEESLVRASRNTEPAYEKDGKGLVQAFNRTKNRAVASRVLWAGTSQERRRGLLGRTDLDAGEGIYIVPTQWIHMFGMRFPIDIAFLAPDGKVLFMHHGLKPNRLSRPVWRAEGALELKSGTLRATQTAIGDIIEFRKSDIC